MSYIASLDTNAYGQVIVDIMIAFDKYTANGLAIYPPPPPKISFILCSEAHTDTEKNQPTDGVSHKMIDGQTGREDYTLELKKRKKIRNCSREITWLKREKRVRSLLKLALKSPRIFIANEPTRPLVTKTVSTTTSLHRLSPPPITAATSTAHLHHNQQLRGSQASKQNH